MNGSFVEEIQFVVPRASLISLSYVCCVSAVTETPLSDLEIWWSMSVTYVDCETWGDVWAHESRRRERGCPCERPFKASAHPEVHVMADRPEISAYLKGTALFNVVGHVVIVCVCVCVFFSQKGRPLCSFLVLCYIMKCQYRLQAFCKVTHKAFDLC